MINGEMHTWELGWTWENTLGSQAPYGAGKFA
jgi:hypothetical protein